MEYVFLLYVNEKGWTQLTPQQQKQGVAAYEAYSEALRRAGVFKGTNRLQGSSVATTVSIADGKSLVLDGPYAETKEQLGGYYIVDVPDIDSAISWAARCPAADHGIVEVRPLWV